MSYLVGSSRVGNYLMSCQIIERFNLNINLITIGASDAKAKSSKLCPNWYSRVNTLDKKKYTLFISSVHVRLNPNESYAATKRREEEHVKHMFPKCLILRTENIIGLPEKDGKFEIMKYVKRRKPSLLLDNEYKNFLPARMLGVTIGKLCGQNITGIVEVGSIYPVSPLELYSFYHSADAELELTTAQICSRRQTVNHDPLLKYIGEDEMKIKRWHLV